MKRILCMLIFFLASQVLQAGTISGKSKCQGLADHGNAVVYAERFPRENISPPLDTVVLDQINLTFVPHVLPVLVGTTVSFPNSDELRHNVFSFSPPKLFNLGIYPRGTLRQVIFDQPGEVVLLCNIHMEMSAYVLVLETPYFTVTPKDGSYSLKNLSAGKYKLSVWHERCKPVSQPIEIKGTEEIPFSVELTRR